MSLPSSKSGFIPELNGLRGVAILGVMLFHAGIPIFQGGFIGVDIFFVLSGFLITRILVNEFEHWKAIDLKIFYIRRILRLAPALVVMLLLYCLASLIFLPKEIARENYVDALIALTYCTNWAWAFNIHPPTDLSHTWSLAIEEQFYVLWPIFLFTILRVFKRRRISVAITIVIALLSWLARVYMTLSGSYAQRLYSGLDTRADGLMLGCAIGIVLSSKSFDMAIFQKWSNGLAAASLLSITGLIGLAIYGRNMQPLMYYAGFTLVELFTAVLLLDVVLNPHSMTKRLLSGRWLVWVGTVSYGIYLWHHPIYRVLQTLGMNELLVFLVGSLLALLVAAISYQFIESPILKQKKHFSVSAVEPAGD